MAGRVILFGATGYTGELTARELVAQGTRPILAARSAERVAALADELGGLESAAANIQDPSSIRDLLSKGDALITTVGPFTRMGDPALDAARSAGAHYVDSTGEPAWIRRVFRQTDDLAAAGIAAVPAFGFDYVPGNLAAALALDAASGVPATVDVGYFTRGPVKASGGTMASAGGVLLAPGYQYADGGLRRARAARTDRTFETSAGRRTGISIGGSEHLAVPLIAPAVQNVNVYLGVTAGNTAPLRYGTAALYGATRIPGGTRLLNWALGKALPGSTGGPTEAERARNTSMAVADVFDESGRQLSHVELNGPNPYELTASFLAWAGIVLAADGPATVGAQGPVSAFGLEALRSGCAAAGLRPVNG